MLQAGHGWRPCARGRRKGLEVGWRSRLEGNTGKAGLLGLGSGFNHRLNVKATRILNEAHDFVAKSKDVTKLGQAGNTALRNQRREHRIGDLTVVIQDLAKRLGVLLSNHTTGLCIPVEELFNRNGGGHRLMILLCALKGSW